MISDNSQVEQVGRRVSVKGTQAQLLISILSVTSTVTKIVGGYLLDKQKAVRTSTVVLISMYSMSLSHLIAGTCHSSTTMVIVRNEMIESGISGEEAPFKCIQMYFKKHLAYLAYLS